MEIPIQNIYYLLCYAWDKLEERDIVAVNPTDQASVIDLFSRVLVAGISHLFKKGLDRGYVFHSDETARIRGKINFTATLKRNYFSQPVLTCEYDELSYDVLHNQILKSVVKMLVNCEDVDGKVHHELVSTYRRLQAIQEVALTKKHFRLVQLHRNNFFYDFLLKVCELIWDNLLISEGTGKSRFRDFLRDEKQMAALFEAFVRNFYKKEQSRFSVCSETIKWDAVGPDGSLPEYLPMMKTDVSLHSAVRKIVIDTKYYKNALQTYYEKQSAHSGNLYQLFSYLKNLERNGGPNKTCEGILLYPTVTYELAQECVIQGHRIVLRTINLNQDWNFIHDNLLAMIN